MEHPASGGLNDYPAGVPAHLPGAGNDYSFAPPVAGHPVLVSVASNCAFCHGGDGARFFSFDAKPDAPPVRRLNVLANEHARAVARTKMEQASFKKLMEDWK